MMELVCPNTDSWQMRFWIEISFHFSSEDTRQAPILHLWSFSKQTERCVIFCQYALTGWFQYHYNMVDMIFDIIRLHERDISDIIKTTWLLDALLMRLVSPPWRPLYSRPLVPNKLSSFWSSLRIASLSLRVQHETDFLRQFSTEK